MDIVRSLQVRNIAGTMLAILGAVVVYAKIQGYSWWLIGSWRGAVAVLGVIGLLMLMAHASELMAAEDLRTWAEAVLWATAGALLIVGLFYASHAMFYLGAIALGLVWLATLARYIRSSTQGEPTIPYANT